MQCSRRWELNEIMNNNAENPQKGKNFEKIVQNWAEEYFERDFVSEAPVDIGNPPRPHRFDLVSEDNKIVIECKCYTWTESGNVPSAKLATLDEAILYMRSIACSMQKNIAMKYSWNEKKNISLADYFCEKKGHLLGDISVWEIDEEGDFRLIRDGQGF